MYSLMRLAAACALAVVLGGQAHAASDAWEGVFESQTPLEMQAPPEIEQSVKQDPRSPPFVPYPPGSEGITGSAGVEFLVRADGSVDPTTVKLLSGTGNKALDDAVVKAAAGWRFRPAMSSDKPVAAMHRELMVFTPKRPAPDQRVQPRQDPRHPITLPPYPASSVSLGEHGAVILGFVVRTDGTLDPDSVVVTGSSGYPALDRAAIDHAITAWRFLPATENGVAVNAPHQFRVVFDLLQRPPGQ